MTGDQKAAFLENVARRLEKHGDVGGAQAARIWVVTVLERETGFRPDNPRVNPAPNLPPRQMMDRLHELADWTWRAENRLYLSAGVLRDCCHYLSGVLEREERQQREGRQR